MQHIHADEAVAVRKFMRENPGTRVEFRQVSFQLPHDARIMP